MKPPIHEPKVKECHKTLFLMVMEGSEIVSGEWDCLTKLGDNHGEKRKVARHVQNSHA